MQGSSRTALAATRKVLGSTFSGLADAKTTASQLFAVVDIVDSNATLRRALTDPSRDAEAKRGLVQRLFGGKLSAETMSVLDAAVSERWSSERDFSDALEELAVEAATASAERAGRVDAFENELFRFERIVADDHGLDDAFNEHSRSAADKEGLVRRLLDGKVTPETELVAQRAGAHSRGRRFERTIKEFLDAVAHRRGQSQATITVASPLTDEQKKRLSESLSKMYGKPVHINVVIDPKVMGGVKVQIGDDVIDGTIARRLDEARAHLAG